MGHLLEVTIRSRKHGVSEGVFLAARQRAMEALLTVPGVGPLEAFDNCASIPASDPPLTLALIRYQSVWTVVRVGLTPRVMKAMIPYLRAIDLRVAVFVRPVPESTVPSHTDLEQGFDLVVHTKHLRGTRTGQTLVHRDHTNRQRWTFRTVFGVRAVRSQVTLFAPGHEGHDEGVSGVSDSAELTLSIRPLS